MTHHIIESKEGGKARMWEVQEYRPRQEQRGKDGAFSKSKQHEGLIVQCR